MRYESIEKQTCIECAKDTFKTCNSGCCSREEQHNKYEHENGMKAGIAVSPDTPVSDVFPYLSMLQDDDFVLLMTVHPGYGKQKFLDYVLDKIKELRAEMNAKQLNLHIQVDGGIQAETAKLCREAGADNLVSGSYLFCSESPAEAVRSLR